MCFKIFCHCKGLNRATKQFSIYLRKNVILLDLRLIPYFLPMLETLEKAIQDKATGNYKAIVYVDGIDKKKAAELTNALRVRNIKLEFVRSSRDESDPLIRLADRWAGCARAASLGKKEEKEIFKKAERKTYIKKV